MSLKFENGEIVNFGSGLAKIITYNKKSMWCKLQLIKFFPGCYLMGCESKYGFLWTINGIKKLSELEKTKYL